jgi:hypothetical protein
MSARSLSGAREQAARALLQPEDNNEPLPCPRQRHNLQPMISHQHLAQRCRIHLDAGTMAKGIFNKLRRSGTCDFAVTLPGADASKADGQGQSHATANPGTEKHDTPPAHSRLVQHDQKTWQQLEQAGQVRGETPRHASTAMAQPFRRYDP